MDECINRHVNDSLTLIPIIKENVMNKNEMIKLVDVGSGAGIPGIIYAITQPSWKVIYK